VPPGCGTRTEYGSERTESVRPTQGASTGFDRNVTGVQKPDLDAEAGFFKTTMSTSIYHGDVAEIVIGSQSIGNTSISRTARRLHRLFLGGLVCIKWDDGCQYLLLQCPDFFKESGVWYPIRLLIHHRIPKKMVS